MKSLIEMNFLREKIDPPRFAIVNKQQKPADRENERFSRKLNYCEEFNQDLVLNCVSNASRIP